MPPGDRTTHHPTPRCITGMLPIKVHSFIHSFICRKKTAQTYHLEINQMQRHGECDVPTPTVSCGRAPPAIRLLLALLTALWLISNHLDKGLEVTARKQPKKDVLALQSCTHTAYSTGSSFRLDRRKHFVQTEASWRWSAGQHGQ